MERERETLEQDIHVRYATLFRLAAEARDASLASLRDAAQAVKDRLQAEETLAKNALQRLRHGSAEVTGARSSSAQAQARLLSDEELLRFQEQTFGSGDGPVLCWLDAEHGDTASVEKSLQSFVGTAVEATQASGQTAGSEAVGVNAAQDQRPKLQGEVYMTENESPNELPGNAGATRDWQKAFDGLVDRINELTSLKDKNLILCQDLEVVKAENSRLRRDVTDSIANLARVVDDVNALQGDHSGLKTEVASSKSAVATLQHAMTVNDTKVGVLYQDLAKVADEVIVLQGDHSGLKTEVTSSKSAVATLQQEMTDNTSSKSDVVALQQAMTDNNTKVGALRVKMGELDIVLKLY